MPKKIEADQIFLTGATERLRFHWLRGKGHMIAYMWNRFRWHNYPRLRIVAGFPLHVDIEISSLCNMRCPMCYTGTDLYAKRVNRKLMDYALFTRIIDECADHGLFSVRLSLRGEPFMHPKALEMLKYAKDKGIKEVSALTNALELDEEKFARLVDGGLDWLTISIDGWDERYEEIRKPARFSDVYRKVQGYRRIKADKGSAKPVIKVQSVWPAIQHDPKHYYDLFKPYVDEVASNPLIDFLREDSDKEFISDFTCPYLWQRMSIGADGKILMCQCDDMEERILGNAYTDSLYSIWHGEALTEARRIHTRHTGYKELEPCKHCAYPRSKEVCRGVSVGGRKIRVEKYTGRDDGIGPRQNGESR